MGEFAHSFDVFCSSAESLEDGLDVSSWLHRDDSQLILLVDPDEEGLLVVVEDASAFWPVSVEVAGIEEAVTLIEQEMIVDKLLLLLRSHGSKGIEGTSKFSFKTVASLDNLLLDLISLFLRNSWTKRILSQVAAYSDAS